MVTEPQGTAPGLAGPSASTGQAFFNPPHGEPVPDPFSFEKPRDPHWYKHALFYEVLIRGFLYRGWAASRLGPIGAVVLTSAVWTILHTQYDWLVLSQIFCIGLLLGAIRRRGGSTTSTMILHAIQNSWSFVFFVLLDKLGLIGA